MIRNGCFQGLFIAPVARSLTAAVASGVHAAASAIAPPISGATYEMMAEAVRQLLFDSFQWLRGIGTSPCWPSSRLSGCPKCWTAPSRLRSRMHVKKVEKGCPARCFLG